MAIERSRNMVVRVSDDELLKVKALADDRGESIAAVFRRWLLDAYAARWGEKPPPAATTKFGATISPSKVSR